jgi:hypothetical protein
MHPSSFTTMQSKLGALRPGMFSNASDQRTRTCSVDGCFETTRERKIYCTDHVEQQPYIQELLAQIHERESEDNKVMMEGPSAVNMGGITIKEILLLLKQRGPRTEERLTRELHLEKSMVHNYVVALNKKGIVEYHSTARFDQSIALVGDTDDDRIRDE